MLKSDRDKQLDMLDDLSPYWGAMGEGRLRQITGVLIREGGTVEGDNLAHLEEIHAEFCGGES